LSKLIEKGVDVQHKNHRGDTALIRAIARGKRQNALTLIPLSKGVLNHTNKSGDAAIHAAANRGDEKVVAELLENGADINQLSGQHESALIIATSSDYTSLVKLLILKRANIFLENAQGQTAKQIAFEKGFKTIELLLESVGGY
jgi:ankyrin repeat protein